MIYHTNLYTKWTHLISYTFKNISIVSSNSASDNKGSLIRRKESYPRPEDLCSSSSAEKQQRSAVEQQTCKSLSDTCTAQHKTQNTQHTHTSLWSRFTCVLVCLSGRGRGLHSEPRASRCACASLWDKESQEMNPCTYIMRQQNKLCKNSHQHVLKALTEYSKWATNLGYTISRLTLV